MCGVRESDGGNGAAARERGRVRAIERARARDIARHRGQTYSPVPLLAMCGNAPPSKPAPRGGRSRKEIDVLKRHKAWFRWTFLELERHEPGCRWVRFLHVFAAAAVLIFVASVMWTAATLERPTPAAPPPTGTTTVPTIEGIP